jgi:chromosome partitioning protein
MIDRRQRMAQAIEARIRELYGDLVYQTVIPENVKLKEAPVSGQPVIETDPTSAGAVAYVELAEEVDQ